MPQETKLPPERERHEGREADEHVAVLRRKLIVYMEAAAHATSDVTARPVSLTRHTLDYARFLISARRKLTRVSAALRSADQERHETLLRQAHIAYLTNPERFSRVKGRTDVLKAWTTLLMEAVEKVEADDAKRERYAASAPFSQPASSAVAAASKKRRRRTPDA